MFAVMFAVAVEFPVAVALVVADVEQLCPELTIVIFTTTPS